MKARRRGARSWLAATALALGLSGCASVSVLPGHGHGHGHPAASVGRDTPTASAAAVAVVRRWSQALLQGRVRLAASYFARPSVFDDGSGAILRIGTLAEAEVANASLSCGARFMSAYQDGVYVNVLFRLVARAGAGGGGACGRGVGQTARTRFLIRRGRIVAWLRAPSQPGDPNAPASPSAPTPPTTPSSPSSPGGGGSAV